jgi:hypothetical protein
MNFQFIFQMQARFVGGISPSPPAPLPEGEGRKPFSLGEKGWDEGGVFGHTASE